MSTDGLIEEMNNQKLYGIDRVKNILKTNYYLPPEIVTEEIKSDFRQFSGSLQGTDDITFLVLQRQPKFLDRWPTVINGGYEMVEQLRNKFKQFLLPYCSEDNIDLLLIGFQEMVVNAIEHGNQQDITKQVFIEVFVKEEFIRVDIGDEGAGFDWKNKLKVELDYSKLREGGQGVILARKACDYIFYNQEGNKVSLIKIRDKRD